MRFPQNESTDHEILQQLEALRQGDADWRSGKTWSLVYPTGDQHPDFVRQAHSLFFTENALNPMAFKSLKRMEHEVVRMCADLFNADRQVVGTLTSGGTESLLLAVKTYRDIWRLRHPRRLGKPQILLPESAHIAFHKAAEYFDCQLRFIPLDASMRARPDELRKMLGPRAMMVVASAPNYPFGTLDPVDDMARLAHQAGVPLHVDACLGGFLLPFLEGIGQELPRFDFRVPGVASLSADLHKYAYAAKGASVLLYRGMDLLRHQFFAYADWPGGMFISPALLGTRPGGAIAAAWASLNRLGRQGLERYARQIHDASQRLKEGIRQIPELELLGDPPASVLAYRSRLPGLSIYAVADRLQAKGWHIDRQQRPESLHAMVSPHHGPIVDEFLRDLREAVAQVKARPGAGHKGQAALYGMMAQIPLRGMVRQELLKTLEALYGPEGRIPDLANQPPDWKTRAAARFLRLREKLALLRPKP